MQILGDFNERCNFSIHNMPLDEFLKVHRNIHNPIIDLDSSWMMKQFIGQIQIDYFSERSKCKYCKTQPVTNIHSDYCEECEAICIDREKTIARDEAKRDEAREH